MALWIFWSIVLVYISVQDIRHHCFPLWNVIVLGVLTVWICPACLGDILWYGGVLSLLKYLGEWKYNKTYMGWGDVEILALLSSQSTYIPGFFMVSGILGALSCILFHQRGIPFVPVMTLAWYGVEVWNTYVWGPEIFTHI